MKRYIGKFGKRFCIFGMSKKDGDGERIRERGGLLREELNKFDVFFGDTVSRFVDIGKYEKDMNFIENHSFI